MSKELTSYTHTNAIVKFSLCISNEVSIFLMYTKSSPIELYMSG